MFLYANLETNAAFNTAISIVFSSVCFSMVNTFAHLQRNYNTELIQHIAVFFWKTFFNVLFIVHAVKPIA